MISIKGLTKYYGTTCAVDHINFEVKKGEILGLLGPNGAGKTTTLRMLTCYMTPTDGDIMVDSYNIYDDSLKIKKILGYLPESAPLYKHMIVYDYLSYIADIREIPKENQEKRIHDLASICNITGVMHKNIEELSKGYKQRVGLAHALMSDPEILVLDEPTSGLDPNQVVEMREIIKTLGKTKTIILSTHILSEVEATCDRVVIISQGKIVADNSTEKLRKAAGHEYTINLSLKNANLNDVKSRLNGIAGIHGIEVNSAQKNDLLNLQLNCGSETDLREDIYNVIKSNDWVLMEYMREMKSLENIFRHLTREN